MRILIALLALVFMFLMTSNLHISFKPFSISLPNWDRGVAYVILTIAALYILIGMNYDAHLRGKMEATKVINNEFEKMSDDIHKVFKDDLKSDIERARNSKQKLYRLTADTDESGFNVGFESALIFIEEEQKYKTIKRN